MFGRKNRKDTAEQAAEYATRRDFEKIFTDDMADLHLLALLLTADRPLAERCFVAGLDDSVHCNSVFREWARSWSKRAIVKNAIKAVAPAPGAVGLGRLPNLLQEPGERGALVASVTELQPFERFVLVMNVLEGYSLGECTVLLGCSAQETTAAKSRALRHLASRAVLPSVEEQVIPQVPLYARATSDGMFREH